MKKRSLIVLLFLFTFGLMAQQKPIVKTQQGKPVEQSQPASQGKFTGTIFNDFYYVVMEPQPGNVTNDISGRNGSIMRRAMIGYDYSFNKDVSASVVYDASANILTEGYAEIKNLAPMMDMKAGLSQTLSSEVVEKIWDYRSLEATVLDKKGMTNEFDMGLTLTGRTNAQGTTYARLAVYNGTGVTAENDKVKKFAMAVGNWFDKSSVLELYVDYENVGGGRSTITGKLFYGMSALKYTLGGEAFYRMNRKFSGTADVTPVGGSIFGWYEMMKSLRAVVRVDASDDDLSVTTTGYRDVYANVGMDYAPVPEVHVIPNLAYVKNLKKGGAVPVIADYIMVRLTTSVYFK
jgi:hypothetical protein